MNDSQDPNDPEAPEPVPPPDTAEGLSSWYAGLELEAAAVNHQIRIMAIPGPPIKAGQLLTVKPFEAEPEPLEGALARIQTYLGSEEAKRRGELYAARTKAESEYIAALEAAAEARRAFNDAAQAVEDDVDEATDTLPLEA